MFDRLSDRLQGIFKKLRGHGKLTEAQIATALREIRLALLEADVHYGAVKDLLERVRERALGREVLQSLTPGQQVVKIVFDELTLLLGGQGSELKWAGRPPSVVLLVGLQGSGKTTTAAKLARLLKGQGRTPLLVAADTRRPAAVAQLQVLGATIAVEVFADAGPSAQEICQRAIRHARSRGLDPVLVDTGGRLHIDGELMTELSAVAETADPVEILLVLDAMTGQDALNVATAFHNAAALTGFILTKLDGDARGGAALSVRAVTGRPIKFIGVGEKLDALEEFHPERIAGRILGMGDILSLVEQAQKQYDQTEATKLEAKMASGKFTLDDFLVQLRKMKEMGSMKDLLKKIPGMADMVGDEEIDETEIVRFEAAIQSMTLQERANPKLIDTSRRRRIARGAGVDPADVSQLAYSQLSRPPRLRIGKRPCIHDPRLKSGEDLRLTA